MKEEERSAYVAYRLQSAHDTLGEASVLAGQGSHRGAINRIYYAMFYAVSALALKHGFSTSSHGQLRGYFNREFVKSGRVSMDFGRAYGVAFDSRTKADYGDLVEFDADEVKALLGDAQRFVESVDRLIRAEA